MACRFLLSDALLDSLLDVTVFFYEFLAVFLHVFHHGVELLSRQARHGSMNKLEIAAAVKVVEDIHHRETVSLDLGAASNIDDSDRFGVHGTSSRRTRHLNSTGGSPTENEN